MAIEDIGFRIKPEFVAGNAQKGAKLLSDTLRGIDASITRMAVGSRLLLGNMRSGFVAIAGAAAMAGRAIGTAFAGGLRGMELFSRGVDRAARGIFNLRNLIAGSVIGGAAIGGIRSIFRAAEEGGRAERRARRQFGAGAEGLITRAGALAGRAGIENTAGLRGLTPIMESVESIQAGSVVGGRRLTAAQAARVRAQTFGTGSALFERAATLVPGLDPEELGRSIADAGTGPQGMRRLVGMLGLSRTFAAQLEKQFAKGQIGRGDLITKLFERSGISETAATDERKTFSHQLRTIGALFHDQVEVVGTRALDKLNKAFGKGVTLAESFKTFIESEKGKNIIDGISNAVVKISEAFVSIVQKIPTLVSFLTDHGGALLGIAGVYGVGKVVGGVRGLIKGAAGAAGGVLGGAVDALGAVAVRVVNWPIGLGGIPGIGPGAGIAGIPAAGFTGKVAGAIFSGGGAAVATGLGAAGALAEAAYILFSEDKKRFIREIQGTSQGAFSRQQSGQAMTAIDRLMALGPEAGLADLNRRGFGAAFGKGQLEKLASSMGEGTLPSDLHPALREALGAAFKKHNVDVKIDFNPINPLDYATLIPQWIEEGIKRHAARETAGGMAPAH